mgnify:CR=1 FL=1
MTHYDYWAAHSFLHATQPGEKAVIDYLLKNAPSPYAQEIPDLLARVALSALALMGDKEYARTGTRREAGGLSELYKRQAFQDYLHERLQHYRDQIETTPDLSLLPAGSFSISLRFTLRTPYLSKDDTALHLLDNPVKKEWVFKLPYIASTQWKGALRAAIRQPNDWDDAHPDLLRLFGETRGDDTGQAGRLYFYPTFFDRLGLEVINPHDRTTGAGSQPILMECVPAGTTGAFTLLYAPLDRIGQDEAETRRQVCADLQRVAAGLEALFTVYGLGAKTSSGYGLAEGGVRDGMVVVGGLSYEAELPTTEAAPSAPPQPELPRYLSAPNRLAPDFASETGGLKSEAEYQQLVEGRGQKYAKKDKQLYDKAKSWWEREGQQLAQKPEEPTTEPEPTKATPSPYPLAREPFATFADLPSAAQKLAAALHQTAGAA